MRVRIVAIGNKMPAWVVSGVAEYQKRLPREWKFECVELPLGARSKSRDPAKAIEIEGEAMLATISPADYVVALEVKGKAWTTEQLAQQFSQWQMSGHDLVFLVGGPDGLSEACRQRANTKWSLSALTLPHPLVRVILLEQFYRAWTLLNNHPYHK